MSVAESIDILLPIFQFGCLTASFGLIFLKSDRGIFKNGPPDAVIITGDILDAKYYGLKHLPASHATLYELTWPLSAVIIDWVVRGRILSLAQIIGATLILGSITLLAQEKRND